VRVRRVAPAPEGFDARFSAAARTYRYRVADGPEHVDPLRRRDVLPGRARSTSQRCGGLPPLLGGARLRGVLQAARGGARRSARCSPRLGARRRTAAGDDVTADAFCHSMVRSLVGALIAVGEGRRPVAWPGSLVDRDRRADDVAVAPPHGLVLEQVGYPPDDELLTRQAVTRNVRTLSSGEPCSGADG
jgi:tRNA pseudouridine38-40 synthase